MTGVLDIMNTFFWVASNVLVGYVGALLVIFVIGYVAIFEPRATTGGRLILRFAVSILGIVFLVFLGVYVDPVGGRTWYSYQGDAADWRPFVRFIGYIFVAYTITSLTVFLFIRKFLPHKVKNAEERDFVRPRSEKGDQQIV
jgi:hypothetical protein